MSSARREHDPGLGLIGLKTQAGKAPGERQQGSGRFAARLVHHHEVVCGAHHHAMPARLLMFVGPSWAGFVAGSAARSPRRPKPVVFGPTPAARRASSARIGCLTTKRRETRNAGGSQRRSSHQLDLLIAAERFGSGGEPQGNRQTLAGDASDHFANSLTIPVDHAPARRFGALPHSRRALRLCRQAEFEPTRRPCGLRASF